MGCNEKKPKQELVRIVRNQNNEIWIDHTGKADGRGAYLCNSVKCLDKVIKNKRLERMLKTPISKALYEELRSEMFEQ